MLLHKTPAVMLVLKQLIAPDADVLRAVSVRAKAIF